MLKDTLLKSKALLPMPKWYLLPTMYEEPFGADSMLGQIGRSI